MTEHFCGGDAKRHFQFGDQPLQGFILRIGYSFICQIIRLFRIVSERRTNEFNA